MTRRTERVAELLRGELSGLLSREVRDPRLRLLTLTRVDVAPDLSHAVVFWSSLAESGGPDREEVERGLEGAAAFLRSRLARELSLKRVPELRFRYDPSLEQGSEMLSLLREIGDEEKG